MQAKDLKTVAPKGSAAKAAVAPKPTSPVSAAAMTAPAAIAAAIVEPAAPVIETKETAPAPQPAQIETKGPTMTDTVTNTAEATQNFAQDAQNKATALFADWNNRSKTAVERSTKLIEEMNDFSKGNIEAVVESSRVAAKVTEQLSRDAAETARKNFEQATAALKSLASVKTPTEFFQLQSDYARSTFDQLIAETSKNSETMLKLAGEVFQPISNRFAVAAEKMKTVA
jgi:phasin family protein